MRIMDSILAALGLQSPGTQATQQSANALSLVPTHVGNQFIAETSLTQFKPLTTEFIRECKNKMNFWAGFEEGRGEAIKAANPEMRSHSTNYLNHHFDRETHPFVGPIHDVFIKNTGEKATDANLAHIIGNAINAFSLWEGLPKLKSENRQDVVDFLVNARKAYMIEMKNEPPFDASVTSQYYYQIAEVGLQCIDKLSELMLGKSVASEIVRESERELILEK